MTRLGIVASTLSPTNRKLLEAAHAFGLGALVLPPHVAERRLRAGDIALGRIDVLHTLDGPEQGLETLRGLEERGVLVLNRPGALLAVHDKLATAIRLAEHGLPHPRTAHVGPDSHTALAFPVVVKPRFGSWGRHVTLCRDRDALGHCLRRIGRDDWFARQGALVQELVPPQGYDLRIVVAADEVVGAVRRIAAANEWRTNVALGGTRNAVAPPPEACRLALLAASAFATDLTGVDLLPDGRGGWVVLELNGAVDLAPEYSLGGKDVFAEIVQALAFRIAPGIELSGASLERSRLRRAVTLTARPGSPALASSFGE
jgi:RimK family alpha-L-glutamate ligase